MTQSITYGQHARATLVLGLPLIGSHLAQMALHVADTVMMCRLRGIREMGEREMGEL